MLADAETLAALRRMAGSIRTRLSELGERAVLTGSGEALLESLQAEAQTLAEILASLDPGGEDAEPARAVIREEMLTELRAESPDLLAHLITLFLETSSSTLAELAAAVGAGDVEEAAARAHYLKGSAANFGAERFMAFCQSMEESGRQGDLAGMQKLLDHLERAYHDVARTLRERLP